MRTSACADCRRTDRGRLVRGLCSTCYGRHKRLGTLDQFECLAPRREEALTIDGISYRQLDYWVRRGFLRPSHGQGSGIWREWPPTEIAVAKTMARLVPAGITPATAERVARGECEIAPGVKVLVSP